MNRFARPVTVAALSGAIAGCAGGSPLLHPAQVLPEGVVSAQAGASTRGLVGPAGDAIPTARAIAAAQPEVPGAPGSNAEYAKGALASAALAPGVAPFVGARVGMAYRFEGGVAYTGRSVRIDARRAWPLGRRWALSTGIGGSLPLYGRQQGGPLPNVDLSSLRGYGADVPILIGWESTGELYRAWLGARGGWEHVGIENLTTEPKDPPLFPGPIGMSADQFYAQGVLGFSVGLRRVRVAAELGAGYASVSGEYNATRATVRGLVLTPATALIFIF